MSRRRKGMPPQIMEVAFVLTFMFLILSTLATTTQQESKEKLLPDIDLGSMKEEQSGGSSSLKEAVISVSAGSVFYIDNEEVALDQLAEMLKKRNPPGIQLRGDQNVPYGEITKVIGICMEAGIRNIALGYKSGE